MQQFGAIIVLAVSFWGFFATRHVQGSPPDVLLLDGGRLLDARNRIAAGDPEFAASVRHLVRHANDVMDRVAEDGPFSVTFDDLVPPSGDKRDFQSIAVTAFPNPNTEDGLPWIRSSDGTTNPAARRDLNQLDGLHTYFMPLSQAYYLTANEAYAQTAASLVRTFFLDETTGMNPNAQFSKIWPGVQDEGFATALIGDPLVDIIDAVPLLRGSPHWSDTDDAGFRNWTGEYSNWLQTSNVVPVEARQIGNHGTITNLQMALFAEYSGDTSLARDILSNAFESIIAPQIAESGFLPADTRTNISLNYHELNLRWMTYYAELAERHDIDIWNAETEDGRGIRLVLETLIPYATGEETWPFPQVPPQTRYKARFYRLFRRAADAYDDPIFAEAARRLDLDYPQQTHRFLQTQWTDLLLSVDDPIFGDTNGDGTVDNFDEYALKLALANPSAFADQFPDVPRAAADFNGNHHLDIYDLEVYLALDLPFGDTNRDGNVDIEDLNNVRNNFGGVGFGDTNGDGVVDVIDLNAVRNNFGYVSTPVPEPAGLATIVAAATLLLSWRRSSNHHRP